MEAAQAAEAAGRAVGVSAAVLESMPVAYNVLPALLVIAPLVGALLVVLLGKRWPKSRDVLVVGVTGLALLGAVAMIGPVGSEHRIGCQLPGMLGTLSFTVDAFGLLFALFTTFVWFCATLYSLDYMKHEHAQDRYHATSLVVLAANLGVVLAGDLVTLYLFFEALGLFAFLLVIHSETDEAKKASVKYWWMTIIGGFALVAGIMLTYALGSNGAIAPVPFREGTETLRWAASVLLIFGFGVKAGMLPVHVWLPDAHPVAPSPASALLSGVMIKAGAYGIFRTLLALMRPEVSQRLEESAWHFTSQLGLVVLWIGIATMLIGVVLALGQSNAKRMLAYHSISQMGFILAGLGAAGYLGAEGAMGVAGGLFHVVNHALFKGALFLGVGAVFFRTGELDMYKLGGLWRRMPLVFVFTLVAALGIVGVPLFNGFVSKCLIHHALVEAADLHGLASLDVAEKIYILTCGGTACSFIKLIGLVFLGKPKQEYGPEVKDAPPRMLVAMGLLSAGIIVLGWAPQLLLRGIFAPGLATWGLDPAILEVYLKEFFLSPADLLSFAIAFAIGAVVFVVGMRFGLFHLRAPKWVGVDYWYRKAASGLLASCASIGMWYRRFGDDCWYHKAGQALAALGALIGRRYEMVLSGASGGIRGWRRYYRAETEHIERARRRLIVTLATGAPGPRDQHFVQSAYVALERERQATVRYAVGEAERRAREMPDRDAERGRAMVDAVRDIARGVAGRIFHERMGVIGDLVRHGPTDDVRRGSDSVVQGLASSRGSVAQAAFALASRRMHGEDVVRDISAAANRLLAEERFDMRLAALAPRRLEAQGAEGGEGLTGFERFAHWLSDTVALVVESVTQERSSSFVSDRFSEVSVAKTRMAIQRYARDMSFNVAMIIVVLLALLTSLALRG